MPVFIDADIVRARIRYDRLIPAVERALADFSAGRAIQPVRDVLTIEPSRRFLGVMPAVVGDVMGCKLVAFYPANEGTAVPTHQAVILLMRARTGELLATMDGTVITEMRTAAVSAAVTKHLMPPASRVLALIGSGVQAHAHLDALSTVSRFDDVRVWSRTFAHAERFAQQHGARAVASVREAVRDADVVVVATSATEPVLNGAWVKRGAHVNAVGACRPDWRELDDEAMANAVVVDSRDAALRESGDVMLSHATIAAEAGELFSGTAVIDRHETTIFKSLGLGVEDIAAAALVVDAV